MSCQIMLKPIGPGEAKPEYRDRLPPMKELIDKAEEEGMDFEVYQLRLDKAPLKLLDTKFHTSYLHEVKNRKENNTASVISGPRV